MTGKTYRDTARFLVPESRRQEVTRGFFGKEIIDGVLKMGVEEVLCLQHHTGSGIFEVTFNSARIMDQARRNLTERGLAPALSGIRWELAPLFFTVVVHVFNPHVREEDILMFLRRYSVQVKDGVKMKDECGYWNGRRRYRVQPRMKADGSGLLFPPRVFSLGPDNGVLFIPEVPASATCWTCGKVGHEGRDCAMLRCRNCDTVGHVAKDCTKAKLCNLCGKSGHLFRSCLLRASSYAAVAEGGKQNEGEKGAGKALVPPAKEPTNQPGKRAEAEGGKQNEGEKGAGKALVPPTKEPTNQPGKQKGEEKGAVKKGMAAASTPVAMPHGGQDGRPNISLRKEEESGAGAAAAPGKRSAAGGEDSAARRVRTGTGAVGSSEVVEEKEMRSSEESGEEQKVWKPGGKVALIRRLVGEKMEAVKKGMAAAASTPVAMPHGGQDGRPNISLRKDESGAGAAAAPGKRTAAGGEESAARRLRTGMGAVGSSEAVEEKEMRSSEESGEEEEDAGGEVKEAGKEGKVLRPKEALIRRLVEEKASDAQICAEVGLSLSSMIAVREKLGISEGGWDWLKMEEREDGSMVYRA